MGNRAVIVEKRALNEDRTLKPDSIGVYLHWNGGRDSVEAFLNYCNLCGYRNPTEDEQYGFARLVTVIGNFFDDGLSVGVGTVSHLDCDNKDNGVYVIDGWNIVDRLFFYEEEEENVDLETMMNVIDSYQPKHVGKNKIKAYVETLDLPWF